MTGTDTRETIAYARSEIEHYLKKAGLPQEELPRIEIEAADEESKDSYLLETDPERVRIAAGNPRSALIGSYDYLKTAGFAFYAPGDDFTRIPRITGRAGLPSIRRHSRAGHDIRGVCIEGADALEHVLAYIDWLPKAGMNLFFLQFFRPDVFFRRWYEHENNPLFPPVRLTDAQLEDFDRQIAREIKKRGLLLHRAGHGWTSRALGFSGNGWQKEEEPAEAALRSRIALYRGERRLFGGIPANTNLCYAREDVQQALTDDVTGYIRAHPETDAVHFWLADTCNNLCECEQCRQTTLSDQYVRILNRIDEKLTDEGLKTRIVFLLYQELLYPPATERIKNPGRFIAMFAPISRTFETPYPERLKDGPLPEYRRNAMKLPLGIDENLRYYAAWRKVFEGEAFIYDYHLGRADFGDMGYMKIARTLFSDLRSLDSLGFSGMVACQKLRAAMPNALPIYLMGRALWDPGADYGELRREYFTGLYGEQAEWIAAYFDTVSELSDTDYANANGPRLRPDLTERYREAARLSAEALGRLGSLPGAQEDPLLLRFASTLEQNQAYAEALAAQTRGDTVAADAAFERFYGIIRRREAIFPSDYDVYRAVEVTQKYTRSQA